MKYKDFLNIIPDQYTGTEIESTSSVELSSSKEAKEFYTIAKQRLLNVNNWHHVAGIVTAHFNARDKNGQAKENTIEKGDYLRVNIPGPENKEGDGYDWVLVEELKDVVEGEMESIGFRVRPASSPLNNEDEIAHFYNESATSSFIIQRDGLIITSIIIDRNLKPNSESESLKDKIRDIAVGISALAGFSKLQWQGLADGLVKPS